VLILVTPFSDAKNFDAAYRRLAAESRLTPHGGCPIRRKASDAVLTAKQSRIDSDKQVYHTTKIGISQYPISFLGHLLPLYLQFFHSFSPLFRVFFPFGGFFKKKSVGYGQNEEYVV
jgi:hypothetical protein